MMDFEVALLVAVSTPAVVVAAMNTILLLTGEDGTLLFPKQGGFPIVA
ncbi:MAG TPA: hypothetical protein VEC19_04530 [Usitatibacter sp.]|nr:hypothetical protein [Usitatibacter sp.]